jgi:hypothetical protein
MVSIAGSHCVPQYTQRHSSRAKSAGRSTMVEFPDPRRLFFDAARKLIYDPDAPAAPLDTGRDMPRLTPLTLDTTRMARTRDRILSNLEDMYKEAFDRARASDDPSQMVALDFAYRREQLYFEILLDLRDSMDRRQG